MGLYEDLAKGMKDLKKESEELNGVDDFLMGNRVKVSSMNQLINFARVGNDTLVHKAKKDLWKISENKKGDVYIERLFDPKTEEALRI